MNNNTILLIVIGACLVLIFILVLTLRQNKQNNARQELFKMQQDINNQLLNFQNMLSNSMHQDMNALRDLTANRLAGIEHNVNEQLNRGFKNTDEVINKVQEQVVLINQGQKQLKDLGEDINALHLIFSDKKNRGTYGEIGLYTILEQAFGNDKHFYQTQYQLGNQGKICDAVIFGNDAMPLIAIDSKFPLENYQRLADAKGNEKKVIRNQFGNDVKKHLRDIADKYIIPGVSADFAFMFIPAEAIFAYICAEMDDVIDYSYAMHVYLVSPTTMMAYVTAIKALYLDQQKNEQAMAIQEALNGLGVEFDRFSERYRRLANDLNHSIQDMKDIMITADKLNHRFEAIKEVKLDQEKR